MSKTIYSQSPLPFQGQKRKFQKAFKTSLKEFTGETTFVDLFGGSGLLSRFAKDVHPNARVIYNDYDDFSHRIGNISATNALLSDLRGMVADVPDSKIIKEPHRSRIIERLESEKGFVDYITLSSSLLFSMNYATSLAEFKKQTLYNRIRQSDYNAVGYLDGLEIVRIDYRALYELHRHTPGVVFLIDPPYLSTDCGTYNNYWSLADYLDVLKLLQDVSFFYFTSNKSNIIELTEWISDAYKVANPFAGAKVVELGTQLTRNARYTDIMIFKQRLNNE